jgi:hypothetical protein
MSKLPVPQNRKAPKGRKNAAHGASRGWADNNQKAPQGRKKRKRTGAPELRIIPLPVKAEVQPGNSLTRLILEALEHQNEQRKATSRHQAKIVSRRKVNSWN